MAEKVPLGSPDSKLDTLFICRIANCIPVLVAFHGSQLIQGSRKNRATIKFFGKFDSEGCFGEIIVDREGKLSLNIAIVVGRVICETVIMKEVGDILVP